MFCIPDGKECFTQIPRESKGNGTCFRAYFGAFQQLSARKSEAGSHCPPFLSQKLKVRNQSGEHTDSLVWISGKSVHMFSPPSGSPTRLPNELNTSLKETVLDILHTISTEHIMNPFISFWNHSYHLNQSNC